ncbi:transcription initiation factor TFIID subunit 6 [Drosophila eugracilis]|uniref:transcription initiation factor TFIID subunit 6 n=1 Tax=Drosophila eugracilis TaxID=29029 RepID=UPI001BD9F092|nr:transcription initiation factor TFIID subunit 6 [Drosophila eugracilis]
MNAISSAEIGQFENKKRTEMKALGNEVHPNIESKKTLSLSSLSAIFLHSTGQQLSPDAAQWLSLNIKEDFTNLLNEAGKYMRRIREHRLSLSHIQQAVRMDDDLRMDIFFRLVLSDDCSRLSAEELPSLTSGALIVEPGPKQFVSVQASEVEISLEPARSHSGWLKHEQVLLKPCKRYPLTKEQQFFYELVTDACVGVSESRRQRALQTLSTDPSLEVLLPTLSEFVADTVIFNVTEQNMPLLLYLMRIVRALLGNPRLNLLQYLHFIVPAVLSCLLTKQACSSLRLMDHWSLREYSGNIMAYIVRHFKASDNNLLPRVIGTYRQGLQKQPLTTVFGAVIGLGKMGNDAVRACIVPQIAYLSELLEPYLTASDDSSSASCSPERLAAKYIRHRLVKTCTPVLKSIHKAPDLPEQYETVYGYLGPLLCAAVIVARVKMAGEALAKAEAEEAYRLHQTKMLAEHQNKQKIPSSGIRNSKEILQSDPLIAPIKGHPVILAPGILSNPMAQGQKHVLIAKFPDCAAQARGPPNKNGSIPPIPFPPASNGIPLKSNKLCILPPMRNGYVSKTCINGIKPINFLLK